MTGLVTLAEIVVREGWERGRAHEVVFAHPTMDEALKEALLAPQEEVAG
jgi:dihydrolipoamide dehydrogenase